MRLLLFRLFSLIIFAAALFLTVAPVTLSAPLDTKSFPGDPNDPRLKRSGVEPSQQPVQQLQKGIQPAATDGVYFSKTPQSVKLELPPELKTAPPSPAQLTSQSRLAAINKIRQNIALPPVQLIPPAHVILTPDAPRFRESFYSILVGSNYPNPKISPRTTTNKNLLFEFNTVPGKTYMIDLHVSQSTTEVNVKYNLSGIFTGTVTPKNGHIIIGFTAKTSNSSLDVARYASFSWNFYRCELTQVN